MCSFHAESDCAATKKNSVQEYGLMLAGQDGWSSLEAQLVELSS